MRRAIEGLLLGRTLCERYRVEEAIGRGGMSLVFRATDLRLGRGVALKVVALPDGREEEQLELRERFRREAASAARVPPHPNVVQIYDYGTDPELDLDFIVMELLPGRDLKAVLGEGGLPGGEALRVLVEAARGVGAGHAAGIVHRDVKPSNVLLVGRQRVESVKIVDFGIAKALEAAPDDELTRTGQAPHSPAYASPEQLPGVAVTPASDVYQLGLVGYELLAGTRPFGDLERERIRRGERVPLPSAPGWSAAPAPVRSVVERALSPRPADRYEDARAFADALVAAGSAAEGEMDDDTLLAVPPPGRPFAQRDETVLDRTPRAVPPAPEPRPAQPRSRGLRLAGAAAAVLIGAWALVSLTGRDDEPVLPPAEQAPAIDLEARERQFRPLYARAWESLREAGSPMEGEEAFAAVQRSIVDLHDAWVRGDLDRHVSHYAERVDFYGDESLPRRRVRSARERSLEQYPEREITLDHLAVTFPEPGVARALVDKSWKFEGEEERWKGSARQELRLAMREGRWQVVGERDLEVYESEREER